MSGRASEALAAAFLPGEPRTSISHRPKRPRAKEPEQGLAKRLCTDAESAPTTSSSSKFICRRCKTIDFGQDVGDVRGCWKVKAKLNLGYEDLDLTCPVCSFFLSMIPESSSPGGSPGDQYYLCATSAQMAFFSPNSYDRQSLKKSHPQAYASRYQLTLWFQHKYNLQNLSLSTHPYSSPIFIRLGFSREVYRTHTIVTSTVSLAAACWRKKWILRECGNGSTSAMQGMESRANADHPKNLAVSVLLIAIPEAYSKARGISIIWL
jgi:hypothetical protein